MSALSRGTAEWARRAERGSLPLVRFMAWLSLRLGRRATRGLLRAITLYFLASGGAARRASREYLRRCLGREPRLADQYRLFFSFASTLHDRLYFLRGRFELFDIAVHGAELFEGDEGLLLMGAHLGSFDAMRCCGRALGRRRVAMAMYEDTARRFNGVLAAIDPDATRDVVPLGRMDSMIALAARLDAGCLVGVLADRTLGDEPTVPVRFLGEPVALPTGPMRMAAALGRRVLFMVGLYRGGNRYELHFEPLADFTHAAGLPRPERDRQVREAIERYAACLESHCRQAPYNWFNFHDFWARRP